MRLDIVIPAHNEEARIGRTLTAYLAELSDPQVRFLIALDDCTDRTPEIVRAFRARDPRVEVFEYPKLGKGGVLMETFRRSSADVVGFVDADCATPPGEFMRLVAALRSADLAIASRWHTSSVLPGRRPLARRLFSAGFAALVRRMFALPYLDTQAGAKVTRREVAAHVMPLLSSRDFLFDVDLLLTARKLGYRAVEVPTVWIDRAGSRLSARAEARRMGLSLLRLWLHHRVIPVQPPSAAPRVPARIPAARRERVPHA